MLLREYIFFSSMWVRNKPLFWLVLTCRTERNIPINPPIEIKVTYQRHDIKLFTIIHTNHI